MQTHAGAAMQTDLEIARAAELRPLAEVAAKAGLAPGDLAPRAEGVAKVRWAAVKAKGVAAGEGGGGSLVLVTGVNPTPFGEGKTVTTIGLAQALCRQGERACCAIREPSMGPVFGVKGGAAGGGFSQVLPMDAINLHFTGDLHAITSAHNLLASMVDNSLKQGNPLGIDAQRVFWPRVLDLNDRALRQCVVGLGGAANGVPREDRFDITAASEVMAILALATGYADLKARLRRIVVAQNAAGEAVTAGDLQADGAMALLLRDALLPNFVQTYEGDPAFVHCGPFANIAHGNSSVMADRIALGCSDFVVTEAGFGSDMGAEKFFHIKAASSGQVPDCVVITATVRAMKLHGGAFGAAAGKRPPPDLVAQCNADAARTGAASNLARHVRNMRRFGAPVVVSVNVFPTDHGEEIAAVLAEAERAGAAAAVVSHVHSEGGRGGDKLASAVKEACAAHRAAGRPFTALFPADAPVQAKIEAIATEFYGASSVEMSSKAAAQLRRLERWGMDRLPVCMAKTQYSFSHEPGQLGAPTGFVLPVQELRLNSGAGFVVVILGAVMTMPGLPAQPAAVAMSIDDDGQLVGVFG